MLTIRLSRTGKHKAPQYRVVVQEKGRDPWSPAKEILGHYNPRRQPSELVLKKGRIEYWLSVGAQPSETVHNLLVNEGIIKADKKSAVTISNKRKTKLEEKKEVEEAKKREAEEKAKVEAEAKAAEEAAAKEAAEAEAKAAEEAEAATEETPAEEATEAPAEEATPEEAPAEEAKEEAAE